MNAALREALKTAIDRHTRNLVIPHPDAPGFCSECRMPHDTETPDCKTCRSRVLKKRERARAAA